MAAKKKSRERSPAYPVVDLKMAVNRAKALYDAEGKNPVPRELAVKSVGYKSLSGRALQILSSLYQYGLIERAKGKVKVSSEAFTILHAPEGSRDKTEALVKCSLSPSIFKEIYGEYKDKLPSDDTLKWYLKQRNFSGGAAETIIQCYKETISFAKLGEIEYNEGGEQNETNRQNVMEPPMETFVQNSGAGASKPVVFPIGEKTAYLTISGGNPSREDLELLKKYIDLYAEGLSSSQNT